MKNIYLYNKVPQQNDLKVNTINITSLTPNCLVETDTNDNLISLPNGTANQILNIDSTTLFPTYTSNIKVNQLQTNSLLLSGLSQGNLFVDGSGNFFTEKTYHQFYNTPVNFQALVSINSFYFNIVQNRYYKITMSFKNYLNAGSYNQYGLDIDGSNQLNYSTSATYSMETITYVYQAPSTALHQYTLTAYNQPGTGSNNGTCISVWCIIEPLGY